MQDNLNNEQIEWRWECAARCKNCKETVCKQPVYVEVVYCPFFKPIETK